MSQDQIQFEFEIISKLFYCTCLQRPSSQTVPSKQTVGGVADGSANINIGQLSVDEFKQLILQTIPSTANQNGGAGVAAHQHQPGTVIVRPGVAPVSVQSSAPTAQQHILKQGQSLLVDVYYYTLASLTNYMVCSPLISASAHLLCSNYSVHVYGYIMTTLHNIANLEICNLVKQNIIFA